LGATDSGTLVNSGAINVSNNRVLTLGASVVNAGSISLPALSGTMLIAPISGGNVRLAGGGIISLTADSNDAISIASAATLTNINNTIAGAGFISGSGTFVNSGTVDADAGSRDLVIENSATNVNAGTLKGVSGG